jgi:hypothetical protein
MRGDRAPSLRQLFNKARWLLAICSDPVTPNDQSRPTQVSSPVFSLVFAAVFALLPASLEAVCPHWDVSGKWNIQQENPTVHVELDLTQSGTEVIGAAKYNGAPGKVKGTVVGDDFNVEIELANAKHLFSGSIGPARIAGVSSLPVAGKPTVWYSTTPMKCVERAPGTDSAGQKTAGSTSSSDAGAQKPSSAAAGKIWANPQMPLLSLGQTEGKTTLTWDAGQNHPNAEVWLKIDDENEKLVVKQAKGSREERLKPNKVYYYILKNAGQQLDSLTVIASD